MSAKWWFFPNAAVLEMHDADTLTAQILTTIEVDCGFHNTVRSEHRHVVSIRLYGLSAPEVSGVEKPLGLDALKIAQELVGQSGAVPTCELWTWKSSFNRYVGRVMIEGKYDLARAIIALGGGRAWDGRTKRPTFEAFPTANPEAECVEYDRLLARDFRT